MTTTNNKPRAKEVAPLRVLLEAARKAEAGQPYHHQLSRVVELMGEAQPLVELGQWERGAARILEATRYAKGHKQAEQTISEYRALYREVWAAANGKGAQNGPGLLRGQVQDAHRPPFSDVPPVLAAGGPGDKGSGGAGVASATKRGWRGAAARGRRRVPRDSEAGPESSEDHPWRAQLRSKALIRDFWRAIEGREDAEIRRVTLACKRAGLEEVVKEAAYQIKAGLYDSGLRWARCVAVLTWEATR